MKTYKSSALTHKRAEVLKEAKANGVIIQECNTNGDVRQEYIIKSYCPISEAAKLMNDKECKSTKVWSQPLKRCPVCFQGCTKCDGNGYL